MKQDRNRGWQMVWRSLGLLILCALLLWMKPGLFGLPDWLYWCVLAVGCAAALVLVYRLSRDFFRGKK